MESAEYVTSKHHISGGASVSMAATLPNFFCCLQTKSQNLVIFLTHTKFGVCSNQ